MAKAVTGKAVTVCHYGSKPSVLLVPEGHDLKLNGENRANVKDHIPVVNIVPFGLCSSPFNPDFKAKLSPVPCVPVTLAKWYEGDKTVIVGAERGLDDKCLNKCKWHGVIAISQAGQKQWNVADE